MSDGVGAIPHDRRGGGRAVASAVAHLLEGRPRRAGRAPSPAGTADGPVLPGLHSILRVFSRRYRPRRRGVAPVGVDLADRQTAHASGAQLAVSRGSRRRRIAREGAAVDYALEASLHWRYFSSRNPSSACGCAARSVSIRVSREIAAVRSTRGARLKVSRNDTLSCSTSMAARVTACTRSFSAFVGSFTRSVLE